MGNECVPPMIVELFGGDEISSETKKHVSGGSGNLTKLLKKHNMLRDIPNIAVEDEKQFRVLDNISGYLNEMNVATAVIETDYVDQDYLDDYVRFYARCYAKYPRRCHRIHFFRHEYKKEFIQDLLTEPEPLATDGNGAKTKDDPFAKFAAF